MKRLIYSLAFLIISLSSGLMAQRIVLLEQFTNSGCPPCAAYTPSVLNYADNNGMDVVAIAYHTSFPYMDSMYLENTTESNARVTYYTIQSVPYSIIDGNYYSNTSSNFYPVIANTINTRKAVGNKYNITNVNTSINSNNLNTKIAFESLSASNTGDSLRAHIVVIEKNVLKSSYAGSPGANSETTYEYVMRKMLPNQNGTLLLNRNLNGKDTITFNWNMQKIKNNAEVRVVAFVQNITTKEVYMANLFSTNLSTGISKNTKEETGFVIYPNPASNGSINFASRLKNSANITIVNILGTTLVSEELYVNETLNINTSSFAKGVYFAILNDGTKTVSKKFIVE